MSVEMAECPFDHRQLFDGSCPLCINTGTIDAYVASVFRLAKTGPSPEMDKFMSADRIDVEAYENQIWEAAIAAGTLRTWRVTIALVLRGRRRRAKGVTFGELHRHVRANYMDTCDECFGTGIEYEGVDCPKCEGYGWQGYKD